MSTANVSHPASAEVRNLYLEFRGQARMDGAIGDPERLALFESFRAMPPEQQRAALVWAERNDPVFASLCQGFSDTIHGTAMASRTSVSEQSAHKDTIVTVNLLDGHLTVADDFETRYDRRIDAGDKLEHFVERLDQRGQQAFLAQLVEARGSALARNPRVDTAEVDQAIAMVQSRLGRGQ